MFAAELPRQARRVSPVRTWDEYARRHLGVPRRWNGRARRDRGRPVTDGREYRRRRRRPRRPSSPGEPLVAGQPASEVLQWHAQSIRDVWRYRGCSTCCCVANSRSATRTASSGSSGHCYGRWPSCWCTRSPSGKFLGASKGHDDYPIYVFAGLTIWQLLSEIIAVGHQLDDGERRPDQEGLSAPRGLPAQRRRLGAGQLRAAVGDSGRRHVHRRPATAGAATWSTRCSRS